MAFIDILDLSAFLRIEVADMGWLGEFAVRTSEEAVRGIIDRELALVEGDVVTLSGTGTSNLVLPATPVIEVSEVIESEVTLVEEDDWFLGEHGILYRTPPSTWRRGLQNIQVTYTHGYPEIGSLDGNQVPMDIRDAALGYAKTIFEAGKAPAAGITSETLGPQSYTVDVAAAAEGAAVGGKDALRTKIMRYKEIRVG